MFQNMLAKWSAKRRANVRAGLPLVDGRPSVILKKIGEFQFRNGQDVSFKGAAN
jgi:hypothetical protein